MDFRKGMTKGAGITKLQNLLQKNLGRRKAKSF